MGVIISAPPAARQDGILPNINVVLEPLRLELSTDQYFLASKQTVAGMFAGFELVDQGRTRIDGQPARWMDYRWHSQGTALRQRQAYQVRGDTGYVITFTASPSAFEEHVGSQLIVEESFRIA
ncbi:MAG TPA: DcrB-related protein [Actinomycetota bacterium]